MIKIENQRFIEYFRENFFQGNEIELKDFLENIPKDLSKTLRINTNKISVSDFLKFSELYEGFELEKTAIPNIFYTKKTDNNKYALGNTISHLLGITYIQELRASYSVYELSKGKVDREKYTILDMAASPGGKTTQLAEYYPNSIIVANEFTQNRITQLISNLERIGGNNFCVTNYNGVFFRDLPERFDKVLIDAPCSGEGIGFKAIETIKHWNIKKIKGLSGLQENLLERALVSVKVGGEILYSTCTLNKLENEGIIEYIEKKYPESFRVTYSKRFWPHVEKSGGFFVAKIEKLKSVETNFKKREAKNNKEIKKIDKASLEALSRFQKKYELDLGDSELYVYKSDILAIKRNPDFGELINDLYLTRLGQRIGNIVNGEFTPNYYLARDYELKNAKKIEIKSLDEVYDYLKGKEIETSLELEEKEYLIIAFKDLKIGGGYYSEGKVKNIFPKEWVVK
ncbi:MAG: hypothetical protein PHG82_05590 [Candidatus Gracilibacteria bacterium]|nr:hypothetical protein [Candidatus Gracilibacteria bacterium]